MDMNLNFNEEMDLEAESLDEVSFETLELRDRRRARRQNERKAKKRCSDVAERIGTLGHGDPVCEIRRGNSPDFEDNKLVGHRKVARYSQNGKHSGAHFLKKRNNKKVRQTDVGQRNAYKKVAGYEDEL